MRGAGADLATTLPSNPCRREALLTCLTPSALPPRHRFCILPRCLAASSPSVPANRGEGSWSHTGLQIFPWRAARSPGSLGPVSCQADGGEFKGDLPRQARPGQGQTVAAMSGEATAPSTDT
ncbi:hypothetical protein E2C01_062907 [Portunus trituberculatus]|uniref:Uncharacterized protein n=1 Tax=Portunus trituberculatus TaxID=210409 RepID=A0A5B7HJE2_PORTR|nr:hypothetical protein [Portunus trituberculatus]